MRHIIVFFASEQTAMAKVAGIPLAARAMLEAHIAAQSLPNSPNVKFFIYNGSLLSDWCLSEINRLAPNAQHISTIDEFHNSPDDILIIGESLNDAKSIEANMHISDKKGDISNNYNDIISYYSINNVEELIRKSRKLSKIILRATSKTSDGIVSRKINRPISMTISGLLLRSNFIRPIHATIATAITAIIMLFYFLTGSYGGMVIGAILFQTASMLDGVDGEIARATFRSSEFGASLDSMTDAATNLFFIIGLGISLSVQGSDHAITMSLIGSICLGLGMFLLGRNAVSSGEHVNFDGLKHMLRQREIPFADWLIWITMRDFLALISAVMVVLGMGIIFLQIFAVGSILWLLVAIFTVIRD